ncbi:phage portal protein [Neisseria elongata]|uniref:Phage portal protein, PBSX family n=1 Tax=Neisseria elongata subsp. glycolytica ATCC 29315 TaxID=546263 RepID=D4DNQ7_NEIEG|nr:phage portal protein [Neisseria elongata]EFE50533.1 phage portal protein, PBSX family [Neisseria elongata subsp. glycolytica ATCC 29315]SQH50380.1 phage capsid portal protein [Neisseria elongata subsp. glycolytica]
MVDAEVFSFEDRDGEFNVFDFLGCANNGLYYEPPVNLLDLERLLKRGVHHASALRAKINILKVTFVPTGYLSRSEFEKLAFNFLVTGNGYLELVRNRAGGVMRAENRLAVYMRRSSDLRDFVYLRNNWGSKFERLPGRDVVHIMEPDLRQEIYGVPYYLAALSSIELNSAATKFRVRYYRNGSHAGFILYATDDKIDEAGWALVKQELRKAKGGGNFNNLLLRAPNGNPEGVKLIPIAEVGAKDEFLNIKGVSAEDMMTAHRVPPALMGIVPKATSGLGDAITAAKVFARNEVAPLQQTFLDVNDRLGIEVFRFDKYVVERTDAAA